MLNHMNHLAALEHNAELRRQAEAGRLAAEARKSGERRARIVSLRPNRGLALRRRLKLA